MKSMSLRRAACLTPLVALASLLAGCSPDQPLSPQSHGPQFSQTATSGGAGKIAFHSDRDGDFEIFVMNADGSDVRQFTHNTLFDGLPLWSPDGTRLTYGGNCADVCDVMVINADGTGERSVFHDGFPGAWSTDGNRIAFSRGDGVYTINADGGDLRRVADPQFVTDWSPDGRQLLLGNDFTGNLEIYLLDLSTGGMTQLTHDPGVDGGAKWSPDGSRIAFNSNRDGGDGDVFVMNSDGTGVTALTQNDGVEDGVGEWSPDGTQLAFSSTRDGDEEIFVMNADGTGPTQLTFNVGIADGGPSWFARVSPSNDDFANATEISNLPFGAVVNLLLAGTEAGEQTPSCAIFYPPVSKTVWYSFTATQTQSITARIVNASINTVVAAYSGDAVTGLTELGCGVFGGAPTFRAQAGTTYHFLVGGLFGQGAPVEFRLEVTPPPQANFGAFPFDPSSFDFVQFQDFSFDPAFIGFEPPQWSFGDGATGSGFFPTHRYAADADYVVEETVTTLDGRSASTSRTLQVRTHDVAITRFQTPSSGMTAKTSKMSVDIRSNRYAETVQVQLFKSVPGGFQLVATSTQTLPTRNRVTSVAFSYTFTPEDAIIGKVTFRAVVNLVGARDALPADNEAIGLPTKVTH
jgi:Tol biopolymer transport system component